MLLFDPFRASSEAAGLPEALEGDGWGVGMNKWDVGEGGRPTPDRSLRADAAAIGRRLAVLSCRLPGSIRAQASRSRRGGRRQPRISRQREGDGTGRMTMPALRGQNRIALCQN